jgi:hypothetical protein
MNILYNPHVFLEIFNVHNRNINALEEINIGLIDILNTYGGFT